MMKLITFSFPDLPQVKCVFQTRQGGYSIGPFANSNISLTAGDNQDNVLKNRKLLQQQLKIKNWAEVNQVHGINFVPDISSTDLHSSGEIDADGMATCRKGMALMIKTADCQAVLLAGKHKNAIAALHVGWRGNRSNFIGIAIKNFCQQYDIKPHELYAVRGPSLGPQRSQFKNFEKEWGTEFTKWFDKEKETMNLWAVTTYQLKEAGLLSENIFSIDLCTYELSELFFSYRRDHGISGRQGSFIWLT